MLKLLTPSHIMFSGSNLKESLKPVKNDKVCTGQNFDVGTKALSNYNIALLSFKGSNKPALTFDYIKELTANPRESYLKQGELESQIGQDYYNWKYTEYKKAYTEFTERFFKEASSVDELIRDRPDWTGAKLREKHESLNPGEGLKLGQVPADFINKETFEQVVTAINSAITSQSNSTFSKQYDIPDIIINNNTFVIKALAGGKTKKVPCLITTPCGNKYIVKIEPGNNFNYTDRLDTVDSVGMQAVIDYYLTQNHCDNSAKMYYYDDQKNVSIYEYVEKNGDQSQVVGMEKLSGRFVSKMTDLSSLGVRFNDTMGDGNVFVRDGKLVMVDNGHCTYDNPLKPRIEGFHKELPNVLQFSCFLQ